MHTGSSNINVPVDVSVKAKGRALRDGKLAPNQRFERIERDLKPGDLLMNPGTNSLHRVLDVRPGVSGVTGITISTKLGPIVLVWEELEDVLWKVVET